MRTYRLTLKWEADDYKVIVEKQLPNDVDAKMWMNLCCDICGKDIYGNKYIFRTLEDVTSHLVLAGGN